MSTIHLPDAPASKEAPSNPKPDEVITNLKAEMGRKMDNHAQQISDMKKSQDALLAKLNALVPKAPEPQSTPDSVKDMIFEDADKAADIIVQRSVKEITKIAEQENRKNTIISQLYKEYPEVADDEHPMTKRAREIFSTYAPEEQKQTAFLKAAAMEAAAELGIKPKSKREAPASDNFSLSGGGNSGYKGSRQSGARTQDVMDLAQKFGLKVGDPKVLERLNARIKQLS